MPNMEGWKRSVEAAIEELHLEHTAEERGAVQQAIADELDSEGIVAYGLTAKLTDAVFRALDAC